MHALFVSMIERGRCDQQEASKIKRRLVCLAPNRLPVYLCNGGRLSLSRNTGSFWFEHPALKLCPGRSDLLSSLAR